MAGNNESRLYNMRLRLFREQQKKLRYFEPHQDTVSGVVFSIGGSIFSERSETHVWVHEWGAFASQQQAYLPTNISVWEGAGVIMQRSPKAPYEYEIIGINASPYPRSATADTDMGRGSMTPHGINHQWPTEATKGSDVVGIWNPAIQMFKAVATETDLNVMVGPLVYIDDGERAWFPTETVDLTSSLPAAGNAVRVLLYLNTSTGSIVVLSGAEIAKPADPVYPDIPLGSIPSAFFYLEDTYTTLDMIIDYNDARAWLSGGSGGSVPNATAEGQQLFSLADLSWAVGKIVTSSGDVVVSGGDVVWSPT